MSEIVLDKLVGQERVKSILGRALKNDNLPQTLIFSGPRGVGKSTCAKLLARHLHEGKEVTADTFVLSEILADLRERKVSSPIIEAVRSLMGFVEKSPLSSKYKVGIIDNAQELSVQAQNALLKTLEEPREDTVLVITVTDEKNLLPTILSRARVVKFGPLSNDEIRSVLPMADEEVLALAQGSLGFVMNMKEDDEKWQDFRAMIDFWQNVESRDLTARFEWANKKSQREDALEFLKVGILIWREKMLDGLEPEEIMKILRMQKAVVQIKANVNVRLALEAMLLVF